MATKKKAKKAAKKSKAPEKRSAKKRAPAKGRAPTKRALAKAPAKKVAKKPAKKPTKKPATAVRAAKVAKAKRAAKAPGASAARAKPIRRRDRPGHIDPRYGQDLLEKREGGERDPNSFIERPRSRDDLVEQLGEEFVEETTSAEHQGEEVLNQEVPEELGGPFVETRAETEFAHGTDPSNPKTSTREPFPRT
jgi:hypothetical protein